MKLSNLFAWTFFLFSCVNQICSAQSSVVQIPNESRSSSQVNVEVKTQFSPHIPNTLSPVTLKIYKKLKTAGIPILQGKSVRELVAAMQDSDIPVNLRWTEYSGYDLAWKPEFDGSEKTWLDVLEEFDYYNFTWTIKQGKLIISDDELHEDPDPFLNLVTYDVSVLVQDNDDSWAKIDSIIEEVQSLVDPTIWLDEGGSCLAFNHHQDLQITVSATTRIHIAIIEHLNRRITLRNQTQPPRLGSSAETPGGSRVVTLPD